MSKTEKLEKETKKAEKKSQPINITGNRPAPDRTPNSKEEVKRQERAKIEQKMRAEKGGKETKTSKESMTTDPRRYYQGSEMQNKLEEINRKISQSRDAGEKNSLRKEIDTLTEESNEEKEKEEDLVAPTAASTPATSAGTTTKSTTTGTSTTTTKPAGKF